MQLSYEIDESAEGYTLLCFEDEDCIWEEVFNRRNEAFLAGEKFIGCELADGF